MFKGFLSSIKTTTTKLVIVKFHWSILHSIWQVRSARHELALDKRENSEGNGGMPSCTVTKKYVWSKSPEK